MTTITHFQGDVEALRLAIKRSERDPNLLSSIQQASLRQRNKPHAFFSFPGTKGSMMSLPPFHKWPIQFGWSFSTWLYLDPKACAQPYLYNFKTGKNGLGYSAHFTGNCLVLTSIRVKGKGMQHCVQHEFPSYKWLHCAITYHNKWRAPEIKVYVNGQLSANIEMPWQVQTNEIFDKCFIGGSGSLTNLDRAGDLNNFSGQMSALYLFNEGLSPAQICAIHRLGPSYMGQFKYSNESYVNLPPQICKTLYEEKLSSNIFCLFTPVAVDSGTLCIQLAPFKSSTSTPAQNHFISAPHAALQGEAQAIITQPICSTLQSLGCSRSLLPLLEAYASSSNSDACASLISFLCDLLESSPHWFANEIVQNNGFVIVAKTLAINARLLLTEKLLDIFLGLTRTLLTTASSAGDSLLLKHLIDNILFNPSLWIYADTKVQVKLYSYLAAEFLHGTRHGSNRYTVSSSQPHLAYSQTSLAAYGQQDALAPSSSNDDNNPKSGQFEGPSVVADLLFGEIRRVSTVLQSLHALKYYYWIDEDSNINHKARNQHLRPDRAGLTVIRLHILQFTRELIARANQAPLDEIQGLLNYLSACSQPNNILDVMDTLSSLIVDHPSSMVVALDQKQAIKVFFTLVGSSDERVCVKALHLLSLFLARCSYKKKQDIMGPSNLFMLIRDRLRVHQPLSLAVYEALIDLLIEEDRPYRCLNDKRNTELSKKSIVNPTVIKVIATLIHEQRAIHQRNEASGASRTNSFLSESGVDIRKIFINDLWNLIVNSRENRRIILQMSVWQHWLINLIDSTINESPLFRDQILAIFRVLLYHAIRYEFGGWRVWIDTLAIIHAKVSYDEFCHQLKRDSSCTSSNEKVSELGGVGSGGADGYASTAGTGQPPGQVNAKRPAEKIELESEGPKSPQKNTSESTDDHSKLESKQTIVSSISEHVVNQSRGIDMTDDDQDEPSQADVVDASGGAKGAIDEDKSDAVEQPAANGETPDELPQDKEEEENKGDGSVDSVDLAPSRAFRNQQTEASSEEPQAPLDPPNEQGEATGEVTRQQSLTSIPLEDPPSANVEAEDKDLGEDIGSTAGNNNNEEELDEDNLHRRPETPGSSHQHKATASPAFRIPEFRWSGVLIKLLNDLIFSIECDLYHWRCSARMNNIDAPPFVPKSANVSAPQAANSTTTTSTNPSAPRTQLESILQKAENQIYIINVIHLISQLADNVIIAAGGLLPLLADATGGTRNSTSSPNSANPLKSSTTAATATTTEGLTMGQANSLLYRLVSMVDMVVFAASHTNLNDLEEDKNTTSGGILRQCLRLACTVTVKNCLVLRSLQSKIAALGGELSMAALEFPKDMFDNYQGCSLLSANGLFEQSALVLDNTDLIASLEYSPHQNPSTSSMPSILPFQTNPIKDFNKLLQTIDLQRIQACIYHTGSTESRQSQFLALSSLYFISVLMVSKYRDIIEPKQKGQSKQGRSQSGSISPALSASGKSESSPVAGESTTANQNSTSTDHTVSNIEANLLTFGKMQPNSSGQQQESTGTSNNSLTDLLTTRLESTLDTVCPLLKTIMCDFCSFLSKTLIGTHGQDLVNKEAERTFRRANASPVEVVMLLCSQEWQNTLQKNAGMAFIELINEGRVLSHGMKDHIVRVAMEADFIVSRLRADDVVKHEHFGLACSESISARLHEEALINSLISSAARRDHVLYCKFKEVLQNERRQNYKLDIWEDDDRRKRRYVFDSWDDSTQVFYSLQSDEDAGKETKHQPDAKQRILELQKTIEMGGINDQCSPARAKPGGGSDAENYDDEEDDDDDDDDEEEEEEEEADEEGEEHDENQQQQQQQQSTEKGPQEELRSSKRPQDGSLSAGGSSAMEKRTHDAHHQQARSAVGDRLRTTTTSDDSEKELNQIEQELANNSKVNEQIWDYDECASFNDFTGSVIFAAEASLIWSIYAIPGVLQVTTHELHFEPNHNIGEAIDALKRKDEHSAQDDQLDEGASLKQSSLKAAAHHDDDGSQLQQHQISLRKIDLKALRYCDFLTCNGKILLSDIRAIFSRHYLLQPTALEIFVAQRTSVMFTFADFDIVKRVVKYLPPVGVGIKYGIQQSRRASLMSPRQLFAASNMTQRWQKREIGNFQYLMFLNTIAGRTYQDLNQYPIFPWILTDYESEELDLNLPKNFRDLSKPIGALNSKRRQEFIERYQSWDNPKVPAFHYGTHYSTAAFTLNWLCRLRGANNASYLALQDGKYEEASRLFLSIGDSWVSSLSGGQQNVKELIPEFFYMPDMFHANLGLAEVEYPPWAKSAEQFVRMHRIALESELVSCQLHQWIDLIFGYKQRGPEAVNAVNTFYYLTYQGNVNLNMIQDQSLREAIETQIKHFGQTPSQLSTEPHPPRFSALHASPLMYSSSVDEINKVIKFPFNNPVVHISACISNPIGGVSDTSNSQGTIPSATSAMSPTSVLTITSNNQYQVNKWAPNDQAGHSFVLDPQLEAQKGAGGTARRQLIDVDDLCSSIALKLTSESSSSSQLGQPTQEVATTPEARTSQEDSASAPAGADDIADEVKWPCTHYVVTLNGKYIIMGSFYDNSFRVFTTEGGKLCQVIYGHRGAITCIARSEGNAMADFYIATGGQDCALLIWTWNERYAQVEGSGVSAVHNPLPKLCVCGHQSAVLSALICSELGLIISGSKNLILVHTITTGENLIQVNMKVSDIMEQTLHENKVIQQKTLDGQASIVHRPQVQDKKRTILEASMLGDGSGVNNSTKSKDAAPSSTSGGSGGQAGPKVETSLRSESPIRSAKDERFLQLKDLCCADYYVTSLQFARELAFIVCVALPPPRRKSKPSSAGSSGDGVATRSSPALLLSFNLKGSLMDSTPIGQSSVSSPKLGDVCALQATRDGEFLIVNDSPITIKIYKTFGLQPLYAYNTNDIPQTLSEDQNRIKSLALLDHKYILVGLDSGKLIVYNCDFKNL